MQVTQAIALRTSRSERYGFSLEEEVDSPGGPGGPSGLERLRGSRGPGAPSDAGGPLGYQNLEYSSDTSQKSGAIPG